MLDIGWKYVGNMWELYIIIIILELRKYERKMLKYFRYTLEICKKYVKIC